MTVVGAIRPDDWNLPLFLHVLGAMVLLGATLVTVTAGLGSAAVADAARLRRLAFRSLLFVALPAYIVMRVGAEWINAKAFGDGVDEPAWIAVGYITADLGALLLVLGLILSGLGSRRGSGGLARAASILLALALVGWVVAVWAMSAKPG
jgi:hypothetical protein